jgi:hypothetical protein
MFPAQYLFGTSIAFGPWMRRQGDYLRYTFELIQNNVATLNVTVWTKNTEDVGDGLQISGTVTGLAAPGRTTLEVPNGAISVGMKELVRFRFDLGAAPVDKWALFRVLPPVWFDAAKG